MALVSKATGRHARALIGFTFLLVICSSVPVLAGPPTEREPLDDAYLTPVSELEELPSATDTARAIAEAIQQEATQRKHLEGEAAEREREETRNAYAGVSASEAAALLESEFTRLLSALDQDPARACIHPTCPRIGSQESFIIWAWSRFN